MDGWPPHPLLAQLHVPDADRLFEQAENAGAKVVTPMSDMFFGSREGMVADPFGGTWAICTRTEIVPGGNAASSECGGRGRSGLI